MAGYRSVSDLPLPELVQGLEGPDPTLRLVSAAALGRLGEAARDAVSALAEALQGGDVYLRRVAAGALGDVGPAAREAVPALLAALRDEDEWVRRRAATALDAVEAGAETPALQEVLRHLDEFARKAEEAVLAFPAPAVDGPAGADGQAVEARKGKVRARRPKQALPPEEVSPPPPATAEADGSGAVPEAGSPVGLQAAAVNPFTPVDPLNE